MSAPQNGAESVRALVLSFLGRDWKAPFSLGKCCLQRKLPFTAEPRCAWRGGVEDAVCAS